MNVLLSFPLNVQSPVQNDLKVCTKTKHKKLREH